MIPLEVADEDFLTEQSIQGDASNTSEAAYYLAEKRGFEPGHELADWLQAEARFLG